MFGIKIQGKTNMNDYAASQRIKSNIVIIIAISNIYHNVYCFFHSAVCVVRTWRWFKGL